MWGEELMGWLDGSPMQVILGPLDSKRKSSSGIRDIFFLNHRGTYQIRIYTLSVYVLTLGLI
jgi:hypothetical protein